MSILTKEGIQKILNDDWLLMDDCEGLENCTVIKELARMAQAAMDGEPVAYMYRDNLHLDARFSLESKIGNWSPEDINEYEISETPLYLHAQQPRVPDVMEPTIEAIKRILPTSNPDEYAACIGADMWNACRAAMLHAGNSPAKNGVAPAQSGNSPAIPDGYVLVPKEATKEILDEFDSIIDYGAEDSVDAWHRLLAAATQEVKP
ncbi:hypothetical protein [Klebsiella michiganensis]|uniref:hypothetical protein n=1 Tax=Klebsiella michiganensis TaxID=1134687 RepID=UPI002949CEB3|nr:hypothetical protein [Klebsiella michiganensis]MDV5292465.1 hypothetical protein [Klebsiella michiganensis]MDV5344729.1 hypothetical protein [Klebsiella michiganensis]MDV5445180.1 hypothetical protein [Klebsiella michiganensis]